ncbi:nucleotidyltransferase family protein [Loktanella sp. IMCC34160]|uniref:nucleotidyltransferase family protein n=1 Tax=Loktanella sp. IMCC34160 TaxID=2510646 RepID=UPI00101D2D56|nr:nucleotidyltransferase family protein [Loktanella sp. IMCC34160]RYG91309.1 nucleotidyltransferase family protein [Loktanella sp. IMCC34160]
MTPDAVLFFAAGLGTRMRPLTDTRPKPLIPVGDTTLIDHAIDLADQAGVRTKVTNVHYLADQLEQHLARRDITISDERARLLETGGGLRHALPLLPPGPIFTMNTDAVWTGANPFAQLRDHWDPARMDALLLLVPPENAIGHVAGGDFLSDDGRLTRGPGHIYSGAQIIDPAGLHDIAEEAFSLNLLWDRMIARGRLFGIVHDGTWCDVGRPEGLPLAEKILKGPRNV